MNICSALLFSAEAGLENRPLAADLANSLVFRSSSWINIFGNPAWSLCLGKSGWRCSGSWRASRAGSWMGTWVPTMPSQSASPWQIRFCSSIFRCGCVCGARSDGAKRIGTSGGGSSRGDGLSDQNSATCSPNTQTRRYILSDHRRNSTSFCPSSRRLAERARLYATYRKRNGRFG
jgi:hypothetical protein